MNKNNKSGVTGVYYDKRLKRYQAQINVLGKKLRLGTFLTINEAENARVTAKNLYDAKGFIQTVIDLYNPTLDIYTTKIIFLIAAYDHHIDSIERDCNFKDKFYKKVKNWNTHLTNPQKSLFKLVGTWVGEDKLIMDDFINGKSISELAKKYAFSRSQMDRKIVANLKRLKFENALL